MTVVNSVNVRWGEKGAGDSSVHEKEVILSLEWLDGKIRNLEGALDAAKKGTDLGNPQSLEMWGRNVRVFQ